MKVSPTESTPTLTPPYNKSSKAIYFLPAIVLFLYITAWHSNGDQI